MSELSDDEVFGAAPQSAAPKEMSDADIFGSASPQAPPSPPPQSSTAGRVGQAAYDALKETGQQFVEPIARAGAIVRGWGGQDATTKQFDFKDPQDYLAMGLPFIPGPKGTASVGDGIVKAGEGVGSAVTAPGRIASTLKSGFNASTPEELAAESQDMWSRANPYYQKMRDIGATYHPDSINELSSNIGSALQKQDILPEYAPVTSGVASKIAARAEQGDLSLNHLDQYRAELSQATGKDSAAASVVRKAIDNHVNQTTGDDLINGSPEAVGLLNRARAEYTRAANFDDVSTLLQKANGDPTKIKNRLTTFLADEDNTAGMTPTEVALLRRASQTSSGESMSKMLGKAGFTIIPTNAQGNGVLPYVMMGGEMAGKSGAGALIPGGVPLVAAGTVAKAGNTLYGRGLAEKGLDAIRNRPMPSTDYMAPSPYAQLESPSIKVPPGGFRETPAVEALPPPDYNPGQKLLPRSGSDTYYQPQGRALSYQPHPDFQVSPEGWAEPVTNTTSIRQNPNALEDVANAQQILRKTSGRAQQKMLPYYRPPDFRVSPEGWAEPVTNTTSILQNPSALEDVANAQQILRKTSGRAQQKLLPYYPRANFIGTENGIVQPPRDLATDPFLLGEEQNMPMPLSEAMKVNPKWPQQKRGGRIRKPHSGVVMARPKSYPALENRK